MLKMPHDLPRKVVITTAVVVAAVTTVAPAAHVDAKARHDAGTGLYKPAQNRS